MPELPEVETVVRQLAPHVAGRTLTRVQVFDPLLTKPPRGALNGRVVQNCFRLGKQIVLELGPRPNGKGPATLWSAIHLRMTGRLIWRANNDKAKAPHLRARFGFDQGTMLFCDLRRFGTLVVTADLDELQPAGLEPLSPQFTVAALKSLLQKGNQPIKTWLLRQDRLVGLGNIYASEILFAARIGPQRKARNLAAEEIKRLHAATRRILKKAIAHCGTTFSDFQDTRGELGGFQRFLAVYKREAQPCQTCHTAIKRIVQQQRSTFYCPRCQRKDRVRP